MTLTQEQRRYLEKVSKLKTPKQTNPDRRRDNEMCYNYADARDAAKAGLAGHISYELAKKRIEKNLKRAGIDLKQGELENVV
jgi:hypothetical protein